MIPNFWCSVEVAAAELDLCFVINGNVWKRTFLPMVTIVVLYQVWGTCGPCENLIGLALDIPLPCYSTISPQNKAP